MPPGQLEPVLTFETSGGFGLFPTFPCQRLVWADGFLERNGNEGNQGKGSDKGALEKGHPQAVTAQALEEPH